MTLQALFKLSDMVLVSTDIISRQKCGVNLKNEPLACMVQLSYNLNVTDLYFLELKYFLDLYTTAVS